jgi:hypothetical protein
MSGRRVRRSRAAVCIAFAWLAASAALAQGEEPAPAPSDDATEQPEPRFSGMDESVNVELAEQAGRPARKPFLDVESLGDLWNLILLMAGGVCGFVLGRYWNQIWGRPK